MVYVLFGIKKQSTLTDMDYLLRDIQGVFPIKAYSTKLGPWGKNTRRINHLQSIGTIVTEDNQIFLYGKVRPGADMVYANGVYSQRDGRSYIYFREYNKLVVIRKGYVEGDREPSFNLTNMRTFLSYVNNLSASRK
jgi:hypothetical protein